MNLAAVAAVAAVLCLAAPAAALAQTPAGDAARGQALYAQCAACHEIDSDANTLGPTLKGVMGRKAAGVEGYNYSPAMKRSDAVWNAEALDAFLTDPQAVVPGTKMPFAGMASPQERADLIAYIQTHAENRQSAASAGGGH